MAGSLKRLNKKGRMADTSSGPPRLKRTTAVFIMILSRHSDGF
jgi:hypothetical protein